MRRSFRPRGGNDRRIVGYPTNRVQLLAISVFRGAKFSSHLDRYLGQRVAPPHRLKLGSVHPVEVLLGRNRWDERQRSDPSDGSRAGNQLSPVQVPDRCHVKIGRRR
jgi:hypothetical protein